ncbi:MAG: DUF4294 domain-containing protein [Saprospiraceae bacterium]|nr:DUF4294 domain-containing protein [Saprospiraceae bacterium]
MTFLLCFIVVKMNAQVKDTIVPKPSTEPVKTQVNVDGKVYPALVTENGDTLILVDIDDVSVTSFRKFANDDEYNKYLRFRRYAATVFPYAKEAIRIFRETEYASAHLSKKQRKKRLKELDEELTAKFEKPLSGLTKLQGKILMKMIEKELNQNMYDLIKGVKGGFTAFYWHHFSKLYSYDLKEGYHVGDYPILDAVLSDFDVSYRIENESSLKYYNLSELRNKK